MHGVHAFAQEVSAYPAVTLIGRGHQGPVRYAVAKPTFGADAASAFGGLGQQRFATNTGPGLLGDGVERLVPYRYSLARRIACKNLATA